jgi:hypothetical protein
VFGGFLLTERCLMQIGVIAALTIHIGAPESQSLAMVTEAKSR